MFQNDRENWTSGIWSASNLQMVSSLSRKLQGLLPEMCFPVQSKAVFTLVLVWMGERQSNQPVCHATYVWFQWSLCTLTPAGSCEHIGGLEGEDWAWPCGEDPGGGEDRAPATPPALCELDVYLDGNSLTKHLVPCSQTHSSLIVMVLFVCLR